MSVALAPSDHPSPADDLDFRPFPSLPSGRPRAIDAQAKERICHWLLQGMSFKQAAAYVACHPETIRNERRRDPQFDFDVRRALAMRHMEPLDTIVRQAKQSWRAAVWLINYRERKKEEREAKRAARPAAAAAIDDAADSAAVLAPIVAEPPPVSSGENPELSGEETFSPSPPGAPKKVLDAMLAVMEKTLEDQRRTPVERELGAMRPSEFKAGKRSPARR